MIKDNEEMQYLATVRQRKEKESDYSYCLRVGRTIIESIDRMGSIYVNGNALFFFDDEDKILYSVPPLPSQSDFERFLLMRLNFSAAHRYGRIIYERLLVEMLTEAKPAEIHRFSTFKKGAFYFRSSDNRIGVVTEDSVYYKDNGYRGILFLKNDWMEDLPETKASEDSSYFLEHFLNNIWFDGKEEYPENVQRFMLLNWFLYGLFNPKSSSRPILVMQGEKGTGKTSTLLAFSALFWGQNFTAGEVPSDMRDFHNALLNNDMIIIDNFDEKAPDQFIDQLTRLSTGGGIMRRPLYADINAPSIRESVHCSIAITTRTATFNRDDLVDRTIACALTNKRQESNLKVELHKHIYENRNEYWQSFLSFLMLTIKNLNAKSAQDIDFKPLFRMVDFESFCYKASSLSPKSVEERFQKMMDYQVEFESLNNKFVEVFKTVAEDGGFETDGKFYSTEKIHEILNGYQKVTTDVQHTGNSLNKYQRLLSKYINISPSRGYTNDGRKRGWTFSKYDLFTEAIK